AESVGEALRAAIQQRPIAGPEHPFEQDVYDVLERQIAPPDATSDDDVEEVIRLYRHESLDLPTAERPLSWVDQEKLRDLIVRHDKLHHHPLLPYKEPPEALEIAFLKEGWINPSESKTADLSPADIMHAYFHVKHSLKRLTLKHHVLRQVHE